MVFCLRNERPGLNGARVDGVGRVSVRVCFAGVSCAAGSWSRNACRRPRARRACMQTVLGAAAGFCCRCLRQGVPLQERKFGHVGRQLTLFLAARIGVAAVFGARAALNSAQV